MRALREDWLGPGFFVIVRLVPGVGWDSSSKGGVNRAIDNRTIEKPHLN